MNIDLKKFVARVRHADAVMAKLSEPGNDDLYRNILSQCGIPQDLQSVPLYTIEVALAHLMPTIMFLKENGIDDEELKNQVRVIRNALAHAGELVDGTKPNVELTGQGGIIFRTRNQQGKEVGFKDTWELAKFISDLNREFANSL